MSKNIVFCADGTWNGPGEPDADDQNAIASVVRQSPPVARHVRKLFTGLWTCEKVNGRARHSPRAWIA